MMKEHPHFVLNNDPACANCGGSGGGNFSLACKDFGGRFNHSFSACVFNVVVVLVVKCRSACAQQSHSLGQNKSTVAQQAEMTVVKCLTV